MAKITIEIQKDGEHCKVTCPMLLIRKIHGFTLLYCRLFSDNLGEESGCLKTDDTGALREAECINQSVGE